MPANEQTKSLDRRRQEAVADVERRLVEMGVNPEAAKAGAEQSADRLYFGGKGPVRVLQPFSQGVFYGGDWQDPLAPLVGEIFMGIPDEEKLVAAQKRAQDIEEVRALKVQSGVYNDL